MKSYFRNLRSSHHATTPPLPQQLDPMPHIKSSNAPAHFNTPLTIVELFQSQSCSSCPPTNNNLLSYSAPNTLILSYHVTYWDHLAWRDTFAKRAFDARQRDYVSSLGLRSAFTPQVVVNGRASGVGNTNEGLERVVGEGTQNAGSTGVIVSVEESGEGSKMVRVSAQDFAGQQQKKLEVWLVRYDSEIKHVDIRNGENRGRVLPHRNVVVSLEQMGNVTVGEESVWRIERDQRRLESVVLVQSGSGGPIVGAATLGCF